MIGFDPNIEECELLQSQEANPDVRYVATFVGPPPDRPFAVKKAGKPNTGYSPWTRADLAETAARLTATREGRSWRVTAPLLTFQRRIRR
ncbi:MAG TPA: hypothetical protein VMB81_03935 [Candidatus Sulfotelmatobacter sp.]|nr:hypothetical protein [Candidatus Sulfotelmatobacter sp.]